jgi:hypothetical protein
MPIHYGDLTVIINDTNSYLFGDWFSWITPGDKKSEDDKIQYIFLFDDGEICDAKEKLADFYSDIQFSHISGANLPHMFEKGNRCYFDKILKTNYTLSCFNPLFSSYSKYKANTYTTSRVNCIYYMFQGNIQKEIFGMIRITSTPKMSRFQFAYDSDEFSKAEVVHIILHFFGNRL